MCNVFVHAVNTTGSDANARRKYVYDAKCQQCGFDLTIDSRVAAHVVRYKNPFICPWKGQMSLMTTCKRCNGKHKAIDAPEECCIPHARVWKTSLRRRSYPNLKQVDRLWCWRYRHDQTNTSE
jgi:hypothetical protein